MAKRVNKRKSTKAQEGGFIGALAAGILAPLIGKMFMGKGMKCCKKPRQIRRTA